MVAHVDAPPKATERVSPYSDTPFPASVATTHLALLVLSPEHIGTLFPGDKIVSSPPLGSPLHGWITSGDPKNFIGTLATSWVFFRDMSEHDVSGPTQYRPWFFARVSSAGMDTFMIRMTAEWFTEAKKYMNLPSLDRSVHHVHGSMVQRVLNTQGHHNVCTIDDWKYEILTKTIVIPKSNERLTLFLTQESKGATQKTKGEMPPKTKGERRDDNKRPTKHRRTQKKNNLALMKTKSRFSMRQRCDNLARLKTEQ